MIISHFLYSGKLLLLAEQVSYCKLRLASCGIASVPPLRHQHPWCFHFYCSRTRPFIQETFGELSLAVIYMYIMYMHVTAVHLVPECLHFLYVKVVLSLEMAVKRVTLYLHILYRKETIIVNWL